MADAAAARPRLLVLASTYPRWSDDPEPGFVHELSRRLQVEFEVHVLAPHAAGALREENLDGVHVHRYRYAPARWQTLVSGGGILSNLAARPLRWLLVPGFLVAQVVSTWRLLRRLRPAVMHAHWLVPQGVVPALLLRLGVRVPAFVVTSHGADLFALRGPVLAWLKRAVANASAHVTVVSEAMRVRAGEEGIDGNRVSVMPMGVDLRSRFVRDDATARAARELLFVGRLVEKKGLTYLVEAMPALPGAMLTIVGSGPEEEALRAQVKRAGLESRVHFLGAVAQPDLPALYRRATLFVAPFIRAASGDQEGLGLVAVEALGCGCPVVLGDVPATRDIVPPGGGVRVDATRVETLAGAIATLLADAPLRERQAASGREHVLAHFDWDAVARGYAGVLQRAMADA